MVDFLGRVRAAWERLDEVLPLAVVPVITALLAVSNLVNVVTFDGFHVGMTFRFPTAVIDVWTFVSVPSGEAGAEPISLLAIPVLAFVEAVLAAGYLGSLREYRETGSFDFGTNVGTYLAPMFGYVLLQAILGLLTVGSALAGGGEAIVLVLLVGFPVAVLLSYLFYGTPFLIVIRDAGLLDALRASYGHAVAGGAYFSFGIRFLGAVALGSLLGTAVVANLGVLGIVVGTAIAAPIGLALSLATLVFLGDLDSGAIEPT